MKYQKLNRTFARRVGKNLSQKKKDLIESDLSSVEYSASKIIKSEFETKILEIGFGMGEHFLHQINTNQDKLYLGAEVFLNGVANVIKGINENNLSNALIWADDIDSISENIPSSSLNGIYVLFPDPWHKKKYMKKRLFNQERLNTFKKALKQGGFISFASDIGDYFENTKNMLVNDKDFTVKNTDFLKPHENYIQTKYHTKAIKEGREAQFITATFNG